MLAAETSAELQQIVKVPNTHKGAMAIWAKKAADSSDSDVEMTRLRAMLDRADVEHVCIGKLHAQNLHKKGSSPNWERYNFSPLYRDRNYKEKKERTQEVVEYFGGLYESRATKLKRCQALLSITRCKEILKDSGSRGCFIIIRDFIEADRKAYRFPAVEPLRYYSIIVYGKSCESVGKRVQNLKLTYTAGWEKDGADGKTSSTPKHKVKARKGKCSRKDATLVHSQVPIRGGNDGSAVSANKVSDSDGTSEPETPSDENMGVVIDLIRSSAFQMESK
ncbi:hypothetical protein AC579_7378 [Pseudocercospora musae]|uniref:Uncharacterized protein n=1 Tax=Pseudocercospora musae TaxID=113226 RepID=A0A139ICN2_9PEZI|nr:hypothetical protein AC579_7378 [Pseudocercospora musae]